MPPGPGSQILPTPAHWPLVDTDAATDAPAPVLSALDARPTNVLANSVVATISDNAGRRRSIRVLRNAIFPSPLTV